MKKQGKRKRLLSPDAIQIIRRIIGGVLVFGFLAMLITGIWYGSRVDSLTLNTVEVSGGETISHKEIRSKTEAFLEGEYLGLVPRAFAWTYPKTDILTELRTIERIKDVRLDRDGKTLEVTFDEYIPHSLWCDRELLPRCVFLDDTGYAFALAPNLTGGSFLRLVSSEDEVTIDSTPFANEQYARTHELVAALEERGWLVYEVEIDSAQDAYLALVGGGEFKVSLLEPVEQTIQNLQTIVTSSAFEHLEPGNFEYIDLRFGNKVFVKEESEEEVVASSTDEVIEEIAE